MSFTVVLEGMSIVTYLIILGGGKRLRENGWRVLSLLIILSAIVQAAGMSIVVGSPLTLKEKGSMEGPAIRILKCGSFFFLAGVSVRQ